MILHNFFFTHTRTHANHDAQKLLRAEAFENSSFHTHTRELLRTECFYTQRTLLHTDACTRCRLHTDTHCGTHTQKLLQTNAFLHRTLLRTGALTQMVFHRRLVGTGALSDRRIQTRTGAFTHKKTQKNAYIGRFLYTRACSEQRFKFGCWTVSRKKNQFRRGGGRGIKREELRSFHRKQIDKSPPSSVHCVEA